RIDHAPKPYSSVYGHLSRIASSIVPGGRVNKGQVIGYVGQTGCATGPHLHFALFGGDEDVNPLEVAPPARVEPGLPLGARFELTKHALLSALDSLGHDGPIRLTRITAPTAYQFE